MVECACSAWLNRSCLARPQGSKSKGSVLCKDSTWGKRKKISSLALTFPFPLFVVISCAEATSWGERNLKQQELGWELCLVSLHTKSCSLLVLSLCRLILGTVLILRLRLMSPFPQRHTDEGTFSNSIVSTCLAEAGFSKLCQRLKGTPSLAFLRIPRIPSPKQTLSNVAQHHPNWEGWGWGTCRPI